MKVFPVVERELRTASRRRGTYWVRFGAAAVAIIIAAWILLLTRESSRAEQISKNIFIALSICAFVYCLFTGVRNTSDCISEERREGTLGLLFLTDLKAFEILFGKLAATSLNSFYGLVAMFPVLALPLLLGGMTLIQFGAMLLILLNALFFSLAVGLCVSTFVQSERSAMTWTVLIINYVCYGWWLTGWLVIDQLLGLDRAFTKEFWVMSFWWVSPGYSLANLLNSLDKSRIDEGIWVSLGIVHLLSWLLIFVAQWKLPRIWQDKVETIRGLRWKLRWKSWTHGNSGQRLSYRNKLLNDSPTMWLGSRNRIKSTIVWAVLGIMGMFWLWGYVENPNDWLEEGVYLVTGLILTTVLKVWVSVEASHRFNSDRHSGALELLLSTPLEVSEIIRGHMQALKRQFLWPTVTVLVVHFLFILSVKASGGLVTWWLGSMVMLVADLFAISYIGMWLGLNHRRATRASGSTIARILLLPWLVIIGFFTFTLVIGRLGSAGRFENLLITVWLMAGLGISLFFGLRAWNGLHEKLRDLAASRFDASGGTKG